MANGTAVVAGALLALVLPVASGATTPRLVPAGSGQSFRYWIDAESIRTQGPVVHYRLHGLGNTAELRNASLEAEVGVRCDLLKRVEYVTTTRIPGNVQTATAHEMQEVASGSRAAA